MAAAAMRADEFVLFLAAHPDHGHAHRGRSVCAVSARPDRDAAGAYTRTSSRTACTAALAASGIFAVSAFALGVRQPLWLAAFALTNVLPILAEWLRIRGMALDERVSVARGDVLRFVATLFGVVVLFCSTDALVFALFINLTYLTTIAYLVLRLPAVSAHVSPLEFCLPRGSVGRFLVRASSLCQRFRCWCSAASGRRCTSVGYDSRRPCWGR